MIILRRGLETGVWKPGFGNRGLETGVWKPNPYRVIKILFTESVNHLNGIAIFEIRCTFNHNAIAHRQPAFNFNAIITQRFTHLNRLGFHCIIGLHDIGDRTTITLGQYGFGG